MLSADDQAIQPLLPYVNAETLGFKRASLASTRHRNKLGTTDYDVEQYRRSKEAAIAGNCTPLITEAMSASKK